MPLRGPRDSAPLSAAPFVMETAGCINAAAERLVELMAEEGEAHLCVWTKADVVRELVQSVAIAVQRATALCDSHGYEQSMRTLKVEEEMRTARAA